MNTNKNKKSYPFLTLCLSMAWVSLASEALHFSDGRLSLTGGLSLKAIPVGLLAWCAADFVLGGRAALGVQGNKGRKWRERVSRYIPLFAAACCIGVLLAGNSALYVPMSVLYGAACGLFLASSLTDYLRCGDKEPGEQANGGVSAGREASKGGGSAGREASNGGLSAGREASNGGVSAGREAAFSPRLNGQITVRRRKFRATLRMSKIGLSAGIYTTAVYPAGGLIILLEPHLDQYVLKGALFLFLAALAAVVAFLRFRAPVRDDLPPPPNTFQRAQAYYRRHDSRYYRLCGL
ncbi:MAG: hypothetical protein LBS62_01410 [Clostridiales bacterium]|jgi:drug/metabolite transporter (DMT)-like permease|nr:hypothetical protein [Clostridiales bacterium]